MTNEEINAQGEALEREANYIKEQLLALRNKQDNLVKRLDQIREECMMLLRKQFDIK